MNKAVSFHIMIGSQIINTGHFIADKTVWTFLMVKRRTEAYNCLYPLFFLTLMDSCLKDNHTTSPYSYVDIYRFCNIFEYIDIRRYSMSAKDTTVMVCRSKTIVQISSCCYHRHFKMN